MTKFRAPEPSVIVEKELDDNDVQDFAKAIHTGGFSRFPFPSE